MVVGNLLALLAFVSALSVPWVTQILPAVFYFVWRGKGERGGHTHTHTHTLTPAPLSGREKAVVLFVFVVGVVNFVVCAAAAVGKVSIAELRGRTKIGCGKWTLYDDG